MFSIFKRLRRNKILAGEIPSEWRDVLLRNVWQFRFLQANDQRRVCDVVQVMAAEVTWEGVDGFEITPEMIVTISGAASLLTLGSDEPYYFDRITSIIVHPGTIRNRLIQEGLVVDHGEQSFDGQAWQGGPIVLSWHSVLAGARRSGDGRNVVIHEFAHHIDGLDGDMGGMPNIHSAELRERWEDVFDRDFQQLVADIRSGISPRINPYAGTNKAEFFAVTSEIFFDSPQFLRQQLPDVYDCLAAFYKIDPSSYQSSRVSP